MEYPITKATKKNAAKPAARAWKKEGRNREKRGLW